MSGFIDNPSGTNQLLHVSFSDLSNSRIVDMFVELKLSGIVCLLS